MGFFSAFEGRKTYTSILLYIFIKNYNRHHGSPCSHRQHELLKKHHLPMVKISSVGPTGNHWKPCSYHHCPKRMTLTLPLSSLVQELPPLESQDLVLVLDLSSVPSSLDTPVIHH